MWVIHKHFMATFWLSFFYVSLSRTLTVWDHGDSVTNRMQCCTLCHLLFSCGRKSDIMLILCSYNDVFYSMLTFVIAVLDDCFECTDVQTAITAVPAFVVLVLVAGRSIFIRNRHRTNREHISVSQNHVLHQSHEFSPFAIAVGREQREEAATCQFYVLNFDFLLSVLYFGLHATMISIPMIVPCLNVSARQWRQISFGSAVKRRS